MALQSQVLLGKNINGADIKPNPMFYFQYAEDGTTPIILTGVQKLSIKGYPGLTFYLNNSEHSVMIYNSDGSWNWEINNEIGLECIKFDPASLIAGQDIVIITS